VTEYSFSAGLSDRRYASVNLVFIVALSRAKIFVPLKDIQRHFMTSKADLTKGAIALSHKDF